MLDARQAELGRQVAAQPPEWALKAWGVPPAAQESAARRADWEKQAGIVASYREAAGITDPAQAIGPVPSGQAQLREAFRASVVALQLPDDEALLRAMGRGELEAKVTAFDRAAAIAPPDVSREIADADRLHKSDLARAAGGPGSGPERRGGHGRDPRRDDRRRGREPAGRRRGPPGVGRGARRGGTGRP